MFFESPPVPTLQRAGQDDPISAIPEHVWKEVCVAVRDHAGSDPLVEIDASEEDPSPLGPDKGIGEGGW